MSLQVPVLLPTFALAAWFSFGACVDNDTPPTGPQSVLPEGGLVQAPPSASPYRFDAPTARFELPKELREISALTVLDEARVGAVQDEDGDLYVLSLETGRVEAVVPFGKSGDYEGLELVGDRLFALRADGALLELGGWAAGEVRTQTYETGLGAKECNAEGLGSGGGRLLIACKEGDKNDRNPVYAFDLSSNTLVPDPVLRISAEQVDGAKKLRPSALAVHPVTGQTFVISAQLNALLALGAEGEIAAVWDMRAAGLEQPEGLAFLPNGDVLVASEGKKGAAVLARFAYRGEEATE